MQSYNNTGSQGTGPYDQQQYRQQYPQQQYPQQYPSQYPQQGTQAQQQTSSPQQAPQGHRKLFVMVIIIGLVGLATLGYLLFMQPAEEAQLGAPEITKSPVQQEAATTTPAVASTAASEAANLSIDKRVMASSVDDNFNYVENANKSYYISDTVYVYIEVSGFSKTGKAGAYSVNLVQGTEVKDPDGNMVGYLSKDGVNRLTEMTGDVAVFISELDFAEQAKEGKYSVKIKVRDVLSGKTVEMSDDFYLYNNSTSSVVIANETKTV